MRRVASLRKSEVRTTKARGVTSDGAKQNSHVHGAGLSTMRVRTRRRPVVERRTIGGHAGRAAPQRPILTWHQDAPTPGSPQEGGGSVDVVCRPIASNTGRATSGCSVMERAHQTAPGQGSSDFLTFLKLHDSGAAYSGHGEAFRMTCDDSERPQQPQYTPAGVSSLAPSPIKFW